MPAPRTTTALPAKQTTAILAIICISYFMVILDNSIIFTGLPRIESAMGHLPGRRGARGPIRLHSGDVIVMDEASMVSNPDLTDVISEAAASGVKVILAGDTQQLQAVESGGGLCMLADALGFVQLAEPVRFRAGWEQAASVRLRARDTTVLAEYDQHARITGGDPEQMMDAAVAAYLGFTLDAPMCC